MNQQSALWDDDSLGRNRRRGIYRIYDIAFLQGPDGMWTVHVTHVQSNTHLAIEPNAHLEQVLAAVGAAITDDNASRSPPQT